MGSSAGSHLSVVVDLPPIAWHLSAKPPPTNSYALSLDTFLSHLLAFLNAHIASKHENTLAVFGAFPGKSVMLYSSTDAPAEGHVVDANSYPPFKLVDSTLIRRVKEELGELKSGPEEPSALVGALTKALCYVNRIILPSSTRNQVEGKLPPASFLDARILVLSVSPDLSTSYIPIMNSIFSAQKLKVIIDVCQLYGPDSVFLQQAAHLTGGSYIFLERRDALLQYLIMSFLPPPSIRKILSVPTQDKIDFRAACFCHKDIIDIGFVCSVCLSIFCQPVPVCSTCRTKFPMKTLQRLNAARPLLSSTLQSTRSSQTSGSSQTSVPIATNGNQSSQPSTNGNSVPVLRA